MNNENKHYFELLGNMSSDFSSLESSIKNLACDLLGVYFEKGYIVCNFFQFRYLLALCKAIFDYEVNDKVAADKFKKMYDSSLKVAQERNKYIHSLHYVERDRLYRLSTKMKNNRFALDEMTIENIDNLIVDIIECSDLVEDLQQYLISHKLLPEIIIKK